MFELKLSVPFESAKEDFDKAVDIFRIALWKPFKVLSKESAKIALGLFPRASTFSWEYLTDPSGLNVLKSEKDPKALERIRTMTEEIL